MVEIKDNVISLELGKDSYNIIIGENLSFKSARELKELNYGFKYAIITDSNVKPLYADKLASTFRDVGLEANVFDFPAGEASKKWSTIESIDSKLAEHGYGRDSVILCVGGGVVTDLGGFYAATLARGVPCVLYPTSTAGQADAAIGGKTGINSIRAKNRFGVFKQPKRIYVDVATLKTLPDREYREGIAEWVKHGIIRDVEFMNYLESSVEEILARNIKTLQHAALQNARIKGTVVELDPDEKALRQVLNYGHTIAHVLEEKSNYKKMMHGEAVSIGMQAEARMAIRMGLFSPEELDRQEELLKRFGLPTIIPADISNEEIIKAAILDKKARKGRARYALPKSIGEMEDFDKKYSTEVPDAIVIASLNETRQ